MYGVCAKGGHAACVALVESGRVRDLNNPKIVFWTGIGLVAAGLAADLVVGILEAIHVEQPPGSGLDHGIAAAMYTAAIFGGVMWITGAIMSAISLFFYDWRDDVVRERIEKPYLKISVSPVMFDRSGSGWGIGFAGSF
jgi:hypothetical protein